MTLFLSPTTKCNHLSTSSPRPQEQSQMAWLWLLPYQWRTTPLAQPMHQQHGYHKACHTTAYSILPAKAPTNQSHQWQHHPCQQLMLLLQCNNINHGIIIIFLPLKSNSPGTTHTSTTWQHQALWLLPLTNGNHGPPTFWHQLQTKTSEHHGIMWVLCL